MQGTKFYHSSGEAASKVTSRPQHEDKKWLWTSRARLENFCTLHRIFVLSGMATVYPTDSFFGQWPLCTLLAGSNCSLERKGSEFIILIQNCYCWGKNVVDDTSLPGKKIVPGTKLAPSCREKNCTRRCHVLIYIQDAVYNFTTAPFSSRSGGYKGAIDRKDFREWMIL